MAVHCSRLVDRHVDAEVNLAIGHGDIRPGDWDRVPEILPLSIEGHMGGTAIRRVHADTTRERQNRNEAAMLPHDVQFVESEQKIVAALIGSQAFDGGLVGSRQQLDLCPAARLRVLEFCKALADREINRSGPGIAVARGKRACEQIEAGPNAIDDRAGLSVDDGRYWIGGDVIGFPAVLDDLWVE